MIHFIDKLGIWHRLPVIFGLIYLAIRRHLHQEYSLINVGKTPVGVRFNPVDYPYRKADGKYNDPFNEGVGGQGSFFGRNILPVEQKDKVIYINIDIYIYVYMCPLFNYFSCMVMKGANLKINK
ncbi:heme peroxidase [Trema orientale]|uniref:Heme peroxidase n=1 Tax=Trema orientale TaxID=63057 RepID=A0A2P5B2L4_TREOI|nr:heme peroxidase [Trema orientale]